MLEPRWTNFLLNCPPNRDGLLDAAIVTRLGEVGAAWSQNASRPPLPAQGPQIEHPVHAGPARPRPAAPPPTPIDGINDYNRIHDLALDRRAAAVDHDRSRRRRSPTSACSPTCPSTRQRGADRRRDHVVRDPDQHERHDVHRGDRRAPGPADGKMKVATFGPVAARYVRLEARAVNGGTAAAATEITVGAKR